MSTLPGETTPKKASSVAYPLPSAQPRKRVKTRRVLWTLAVLGVAGIAYVGYQSHKNPTLFMGQPMGSRRGGFGFGMNGPLPVVVRTAQKGNINVVLDGLGTVTPLATVTVHPQVSGQLTEVDYKEGQLVKAGEQLAVIDPRPYEAALKQAQGQLLQAQAQLSEAKIDLDRYVTLSGQDSISKQQVDAQKALVSQYEGLVKTDEGAVDNAQVNLNYCYIKAPVASRAGLRLVDQGNYVTPGDATGLVILTQMDPITVIFPLPEDCIPEVQKRINAGAVIPVDAYDRTGQKKLASGKLATIDNTVDPTTGMFKLRATFDNANGALFPNQFVMARMLVDIDKGVTVIPTSSVERGQQGTFVYVVDDQNKVSAKPVTLGDTEGERVAVVSGISVGAKVVVDGADRLKEGMEVVVQTVGGPAGTRKPGAHDGEHHHWNGGGNN